MKCRISESHAAFRLPHFGWIENSDNNLELVESIPDNTLKDGDEVIIHNIPSEEKGKYTFSWGPNRESYVKFGQPYQILNVAIDENYGTCINLNGMWFVPYHLEKVNHYDIV